MLAEMSRTCGDACEDEPSLHAAECHHAEPAALLSGLHRVSRRTPQRCCSCRRSWQSRRSATPMRRRSSRRSLKR
eukprot:213002-Chlamydomonas_euryale.AAC.1